MLRRIVLALLSLLFVAAPLAVLASDQVISVRVDERPADRHGGIGVVRNGAVFIDAITITKVFSGLLLFGKNSVRINIGGASANFVVASTLAMFGVTNCVARPENWQPLVDAWPTTSPSGRSSMTIGAMACASPSRTPLRLSSNCSGPRQAPL